MPRIPHSYARSRQVALTTVPVLLLFVATSMSLGTELKRRGMMGVQLAPVTEENYEQFQLDKAAGIVVAQVVPDSAAAEAGLQANDVMVSIAGERFDSIQDGLNLLRGSRAGDTVHIGMVRDGKPVEVDLTLRERPRETSDEFEIIYDEAGTPGHRVRTYITKPKAAGKYPAILLVQSLNPSPMEFSHPQQANHPYKQLVDQLTRAGFVTMRVDRPGNGDSEGGDPRRPKVTDDVNAFRAGLSKLMTYDYVKSDQVFILAQSSGTAIAPALAREKGVSGVITYAGIARPWTEHLVESMRHRWEFSLLPDDELKQNTQRAKEFTRLCFVEGKSPAEAFAANPDLRTFAEGLVQQDEFIMGSHYTFFQELASIDLPEAWRRVDVPVLVLWGECDFVAGRACSELIAKSVNSAHPGKAKFVALKGIDHNMAPMEDAEESFLANFTGEFNPVIVETIKQWVDSRATPRTS